MGNSLSETTVSGLGSEVVSYAYDANDRLLTETGPGGTTAYSYDANGNLTERAGPGGTTAYAWTDDDRLASATDASGTVSYRYDAEGIRHSRSAAGVTTNYLVDPNRAFAEVVAEEDALGNALARYTRAEELIAQRRAGATAFYHADGLGSTRQLTDAAGNVTDRYVYQAFGETEAESGPTENAYRFTGEAFDEALGLYYLRARYMDPGVGRFLGMDRLLSVNVEPRTLNKFTYANSSPTLFTDPSGDVGIVSVFPGTFVGSSIRISRTSAGVTQAAKLTAELAFELATGLPVPTSPRNMISAVKSFRQVIGNLSKGPIARMRAGRDFEKTVGELWGLKKNKKCFKNGRPDFPPGCFVPDFDVNGAGKLIEVKTSLRAVKKKQFQEFLRISQRGGSPLTMMILKKPRPADIARLQRWARGVVGDTDQLFMKIVHVQE